MPKFRVYVAAVVTDSYEIEAENEEEAVNQAYDLAEFNMDGDIEVTDVEVIEEGE